MNRSVRATGLAWLVLACTASTAGPAPVVQPAQPPAGQRVAGQDTLVPAGFGTLKLDDITVSLRDGPLLIKVTPLAEGVIRLLATDTYDRLHSIAESKRADATNAAGGREPELFFVSFFSYQADVAFQPEDLQLSHQGRVLRAAAILPVTPGWGRQLLAQQDQQIAVYAFDEPIKYDLAIIVRYGFNDVDAWSRIIPKLENERARVRAKAGGSGG